MKPMQVNLQLQNSNMDSEITTKVSCFDFKQQLLSILRDDNIMNPKNLVSKNEPGKDPDFGGVSSNIFMMLSGISQLIIIMINMDMIKIASCVV